MFIQYFTVLFNKTNKRTAGQMSYKLETRTSKKIFTNIK